MKEIVEVASLLDSLVVRFAEDVGCDVRDAGSSPDDLVVVAFLFEEALVEVGLQRSLRVDVDDVIDERQNLRMDERFAGTTDVNVGDSCLVAHSNDSSEVVIVHHKVHLELVAGSFIRSRVRAVVATEVAFERAASCDGDCHPEGRVVKNSLPPVKELVAKFPKSTDFKTLTKEDTRQSGKKPQDLV